MKLIQSAIKKNIADFCNIFAITTVVNQALFDISQMKCTLQEEKSEIFYRFN